MKGKDKSLKNGYMDPEQVEKLSTSQQTTLNQAETDARTAGAQIGATASEKDFIMQNPTELTSPVVAQMRTGEALLQQMREDGEPDGKIERKRQELREYFKTQLFERLKNEEAKYQQKAEEERERNSRKWTEGKYEREKQSAEAERRYRVITDNRLKKEAEILSGLDYPNRQMVEDMAEALASRGLSSTLTAFRESLANKPVYDFAAHSDEGRQALQKLKRLDKVPEGKIPIGPTAGEDPSVPDVYVNPDKIF